MIFRPYWLILGLVLYLPFEDFLLKWLPVSDRIFTLTRFGNELALYFLFCLVLYKNLREQYSWRKTPIDVFLFSFVVLAITSIFINKASLLGGIVNLRTLIRYLAVYYVAINVNLNRNHIRNIIVCMLVIAIGESILATMQHFLGTSQFWYPRLTQLELAGMTKTNIALRGGIEQGSALGTFCQPVSMALYLLISSTVLLCIVFVPTRYSIYTKLVIFILASLVLIGILFTYSKGSFLAAVLAFPLVLLIFRRYQVIIGYSIFGIALLTIVAAALLVGKGLDVRFAKAKDEYVDPMSNVEMLFTSEYYERTQNSRQWMIKEVGSTIVKAGTLIGFSPDEETARLKIVESSGGALQRLIIYAGFEDVYWVAMLGYYGFMGMALFLGILYRIFKCCFWVMRRSDDSLYVILAGAMAVLIMVTVPVSFIVRSFEVRTFAFYFWLLGGIIVSEYLRLRNHDHCRTASITLSV